VWDSVAYLYTGRASLPLSSSDWSWYSSTASSRASQYPISKSQLYAGDFTAWAADSLELAKTTVYPGKFIYNFMCGL
jgi:hypothetical protein